MVEYMQKYIEELESGDRRVANNWTIVSFSLYGSILAGLLLYAAVEQNRDTGLLAADAQATATAPR